MKRGGVRVLVFWILRVDSLSEYVSLEFKNPLNDNIRESGRAAPSFEEGSTALRAPSISSNKMGLGSP